MFFCSKGFSLSHGNSRGLLIARAAFQPPCTPIGCVAQCYADLCSSLNQPAAFGLQHEISYLPYALATMSQPPQGPWANPGVPWVQPPNPTPPGTQRSAAASVAVAADAAIAIVAAACAAGRVCSSNSSRLPRSRDPASHIARRRHRLHLRRQAVVRSTYSAKCRKSASRVSSPV